MHGPVRHHYSLIYLFSYTCSLYFPASGKPHRSRNTVLSFMCLQLEQYLHIYVTRRSISPCCLSKVNLEGCHVFWVMKNKTSKPFDWDADLTEHQTGHSTRLTLANCSWNLPSTGAAATSEFCGVDRNGSVYPHTAHKAFRHSRSVNIIVEERSRTVYQSITNRQAVLNVQHCWMQAEDKCLGVIEKAEISQSSIVALKWHHTAWYRSMLEAIYHISTITG